jgi:protein arginine kinase
MQLTEKGVVLSGRIRLARNYADLPFRCAPHFQHQGNCIARATQALKENDPDRYRLYLLEKASPEERQALVEEHLISKDLLTDVSSAAALIREDRRVSVMVNEEDHLRIQALVDGLELDAASREAFAAEEMLAKDYPFSFDPQLGYLTSCPTNTGTGLRASLMLHLPLMYQFHMMGTVAQNVAKLGLTLRGIYGEGSEALGNVYQVSNQVTLGRAEQDIIDSVTAHQHTMGVDAVWSAGNDSSFVLALMNRKFVQFFRQNDANLVNLIGQYFIEHVHNENIAFHKLVKVCEKS